MNQQERAQIRDLIKAEMSPISGGMEALLAKMEAVHEQTTKTNGRVNRIEDEKLPSLHKRISDTKEATTKLKQSLALVRWFSEKPLRFVGAIVLVVTLFENKEVFNIVKYFA